MNCPFCQTQLKDRSSFCSKCGKRIPYCPSCGTLITRASKFCPNDGSPLPADIVALFEDSFQPDATAQQAPVQQETAWQSAPSGDEVFQPYFDHSEDTGTFGGQNQGGGSSYDPQNQGWGNSYDPQNQGWGNSYDPQNQGWGNSYDPQNQGGWGIPDVTPQGDQYVGEPEPPKKKNTTRIVLIIVLAVLVVLLAVCLVFLVPRLVNSLGGSSKEKETAELTEEPIEEDLPEDIVEPEEEPAYEDEAEEEEDILEAEPEEEEEEAGVNYSLTLNNLFLSLEVGDVWPMSVTVQPTNAELTWTSDDTSVATVDSNGIVTAVGAGDCTITVMLAEDSSYTGRCTVTVAATEEELEEGEYSETDQKILDLISAASVRNLTDADLDDCDADMCKKIRNGIYAVHGRMFTTPELTEYFSQFDWYEPTIPASAFDGTQLNSYELYNASFLLDYEKAHGYNQ